MDTPETLRNGQVLIAIFAGVAVLAAAVAVLATGGGGTEIAYAFGGGIAAAVAVVGAYVVGFRYGQPHSHAVAVAAVTFGAVLTIGIVAELLVSSGRLSSLEMVLAIVGSLVLVAVLILVVHLLDRVAAPS